MKKIRRILNVLGLLILIVGLIGCSSKTDSTNASESNDQNEGYKGIVPIYTPPSGNTLYVLSAGLSNNINQTDDILPNIQFSTEATNGDTGTLEGLLKREKQQAPSFSAIASIVASKAYQGTFEPVDGEKKQLRAVANLGVNAIHLVVKANSDIQSYADIKGKKLGGFAPGVSPRFFVEDLLKEQYNIQPNEYEMIPLDNQDRVDSIKNGSVDGAFLLGNPPSPLVTELTRTDDVRIISIEREKLEEFTEKNPYYSIIDIKPGTYEGINDQLSIGAVGVMYLTHEGTDEEIVYNLVKTIIENPEQIKQIHPSFNITLENVTNGTDIPFHEGAKKYFTEKGLTME